MLVRNILSFSIAACLAFSNVKPALAGEFSPCRVETSAPRAVQRELDALLKKLVDQDSELASALGSAPGFVMSVRGPGWRYQRAAGFANPDLKTSMDCMMPFEIGSNTKMMTATVLLQLQEEGKLSLDDLLSVYLPEIAAALPYGDQMTLRELAQHTSGVFSYTDNAPDGATGVMEGAINDPAGLGRGYRPQELVDFAIKHGKPNFPPGVRGSGLTATLAMSSWA